MKTYSTLLSCFISLNLWAQAPQKMSYQAVIRDGNNDLIVNGSVGVRFSVLQGSSTGSSVYTESQTLSTNENGLISTEVGGQAGFSAIDWAMGPFYMKTEIDPVGGSNYTLNGTSELLSVPYALYAANGGVPGPQGPQGPVGPAGPASGNCIQSSVNFAFEDYSTDKFYVFNGTLGTWSSQSYVSSSSLIAFNGNFVFEDYSADKFYVYNNLTGTWSSQSYVSSSAIVIDTVSNNLVFEDYSADKVYVFDMQANAWSSQSYVSSSPILLVNGSVLFEDYSADRIYTYSGTSHTWTSQSYVSSSSIIVSEIEP